MNENKINRRQQILETLALELERAPGEPITTAGLARAVGVSEAALYRHFASKAKMFDALIEFIEESVFGLINRILEDEKSALGRIDKILQLILGFAQKNPGLMRLLIGDVLIGETERLRKRIEKFYERLETQLKQVLREGEANQQIKPGEATAATANLLLNVVQGKIQQFVRTEFKVKPLDFWDEQWRMLRNCIT
jgi:TetR/AcrR family transcriptional regulator